MGESEEEVVEIEKIYKRKPKVKAVHKMKWVNDLDYSGHKVAVMELEIEKDKKKWKEFQWVTSLRITGNKAYEFAETGRKRWLIENEGFNIQKNHRYIITHANSLDYNAMKNHYLLTQLADIFSSWWIEKKCLKYESVLMVRSNLPFRAAPISNALTREYYYIIIIVQYTEQYSVQ